MKKLLLILGLLPLFLDAQITTFDDFLRFDSMNAKDAVKFYKSKGWTTGISEDTQLIDTKTKEVLSRNMEYYFLPPPDKSGIVSQRIARRISYGRGNITKTDILCDEYSTVYELGKDVVIKIAESLMEYGYEILQSNEKDAELYSKTITIYDSKGDEFIIELELKMYKDYGWFVVEKYVEIP
ncbi:hypothetical protein [Moheibacter sediminis]|uniref:Peptidoglycan binding domain-containing protein n=1 Tax=Moheibacter sediminis TaxID=1434700 RepID=A0A1W1YLK6_9FLAO|nr:hypothetical protein [Moheibacter sediminis]SMC37012.1 hypothetical protein SAMN06296427_101530 [Moheibacter sediminis]